MFDRFTDRARSSLSLSRKAAERFGHDYIGTEHILLGVIEEGEGSGVRALMKIGINPGEIANDVSNLLKSEARSEAFPQLLFTARGKKVLEFSVKIAVERGHDFVDTGHLLIGLLHENEGLAAQVLLNHCLTEEKLVRGCIPFWLDQTLSAHPNSQSWSEKLVSAWVRCKEFIRQPIQINTVSYEHLNDEAIIVLERSLMNADKLNNDFIGTEHLLLSIAECGAGSAANALVNMGLTNETILNALKNRLPNEKKGMLESRTFPLTPRAKAALAAAREVAASLNRNFIGTEHLLLGLLADSENSAHWVLKQAGVTRRTVDAEIIALKQV